MAEEMITIKRGDLTVEALEQLDKQFKQITEDPDFWIETIKMPISYICDKNGVVKWGGGGK